MICPAPDVKRWSATDPDQSPGSTVKPDRSITESSSSLTDTSDGCTPVKKGGSKTGLTSIRTEALAAETGVPSPLSDASIVRCSPPEVNGAAIVSSTAYTSSGVALPLKLVAGTNRNMAEVSSSTACVVATGSKPYHRPPLSVEYCQLPDADDTLADTAIPAKLLPLSTSLNCPLKILAIVSPAESVSSSSMAAMVASPSTGASLTLLTVNWMFAASAENGVEPPRIVTLSDSAARVDV